MSKKDVTDMRKMTTAFDFGFTAISEEEVSEQVKKEATKKVYDANKQIDEAYERVDFMYDSIMPLLDNLMKNPENELIKWPDRHITLMVFKKKLDEIRLGTITR